MTSGPPVKPVPKTSPWRALLWLANRPSNPFEPSKRPLYHPRTLAIRTLGILVVLGVMSLPFYPSASLVRQVQTSGSEQDIVGTALSSNEVRGLQRRFLSSLEEGMGLSGKEEPWHPLPLPLSVDAPEPVQEAFESTAREHGMALAATDCQGCVRLEWRKGRGWLYRVVPSPGGSSWEGARGEEGALADLESRVAGFVREGLGQLPRAPEILLAPDQARPALMEGLVLSTRFGTHLILIVVFSSMFLMMGGLTGLEWEKKRNQAALEPFILVYHPPWVLYMGYIFREMNYVFAVSAATIILVWLYGIPVHWPFIWASMLLAVSLAVCCSLWSLLSTVLFHHPQGRAIAKIVLSPLVLGGVWIIRILFVWTAMKAFQPIRFIEQVDAVLGSYPLLLWAVPCVLALSLGLAFLINKRIGVRREGFQESKFQ